MQNINLYVPELRPVKKFLTASTLVFSMLGCLLIMLLISFFASQDTRKYTNSLAALQQKKLHGEQRVEDIKQNIPKVSANKIDEEISGLRSKISHLSRVQEIIGDQKLGNEQGYSSRFRDLSNLSSSTFSISAFRFTDGLHKVELKGQTNSPDSVTEYIYALQEQDSFEGSKFGAFTLGKSPLRREQHAFSFGYESVFDGATTLVEAM